MPKRRKKRVTTRSQTLRRRDHRLAWALAAVGLVALAIVAASVWPYWQLSGRFRPLPEQQPSRLYARPFRLAPGQSLSAAALGARLEALHYAAAGAGGLTAGTYRASGDTVSIARRAPSLGTASGGLVVVELARGRIERVLVDERPVVEAHLEPALLASFYGPDLLERRPVPLDRVPGDVARAVLAAEDAGFFEHPGISATGIARALWTNLRGGEIRQGGSTVTQQLAKNLYLSAERTMTRKLREAMFAVMLEWRYSKEEILEAYLNQIFWGRSGSANLIGIGAAAWAHLGRRVEELDLADGALLAGMIQSPATSSPSRNPETARARRDFVLARLVELRWVTAEAAAAAKEKPLPTREIVLSRRRAPYYAAAAAEEAERRFGVAELADGGYVLLGTLDLDDQDAAESAVTAGLEGLVAASARVRKRSQPLQAALVSLEPATGAVRAWVGGRDWFESQFDRVSQAKRQAGSAFKPIVYATAFERGVATPATLLEDAPLAVESGGELWAPANDDGEFRGWVTARTALEQSLNVPTARLALATGLPAIVETARALGIGTRLRPVPAVALGAFEVRPLELATAYAVFADRGVRPPVHLVDGVLDATGRPLAGEALPAPQRVLSAGTAFLVTTILQGVVDYGTGRGVRAAGLGDAVAGKTGTSNQRRDNWFVGYSPERVSLVWVGFDDDAPTPFSGSRAALPIWARFALAVRPAGGFARFTAPAGVRVVLIDPATGELATDRCPEVLAEAFPEERIPRTICHLHGSSFSAPLDPQVRAEREAERDERGGIRAWLRRVFGRDRPAPKSAPAGPPP